MRLALLFITVLASVPFLSANEPFISTIGDGWAENSVNTTIFRKNSVVSDDTYQFAAYYDVSGKVVVARRALDEESQWEVKQTQLSGQVADAHNSISIALDGDGYLHIAWDHHNNPLRYARSKSPYSLEFVSAEMIGENESDVTYPEFYSIANGDLIFLYRDGESGRGNLVINRYRTKQREWARTQTKLIDGEEQRNAYWQVYANPNSETIHLSWTWRETWDVSTNHDICYAVSHDGGETWERTDSSEYQLPITAATAEYAIHIPQNSELINQTSMCADSEGRPYIASYWTPRDSDVPQFHIVFFDGEKWASSQVTKRTTPFSLSGGGTKRIPISRPQIFADATGRTEKAYLVYRDEERNNRPTIAICENLANPTWSIQDLATTNLGQWEPSFDIPLWHREKELALFIQKTEQGDGESLKQIPPQPVSILFWSH